MCWESDYPHSESPWLDAPEELEPIFAKTDDVVVKKITYDNALRNFQFDPFAHRPKELCTVAALRAEATDVDTVTHVGRPADGRDAEYFKNLTSRKPDQPTTA